MTSRLGPFRNQVPTDIGFYEIPLPPGSYTIEVETIDPQFVDGSSVGGEDQIAMPGTAPPPTGPITVTAGATSSGNDVTLHRHAAALRPVRGSVRLRIYTLLRTTAGGTCLRGHRRLRRRR